MEDEVKLAAISISESVYFLLWTSVVKLIHFVFSRGDWCRSSKSSPNFTNSEFVYDHLIDDNSCSILYRLISVSGRTAEKRFVFCFLMYRSFVNCTDYILIIEKNFRTHIWIFHKVYSTIKFSIILQKKKNQILKYSWVQYQKNRFQVNFVPNSIMLSKY